MAFLRLGVSCAVIDDDGRVLLSRRGDMDIWNLPTGRLDAYESMKAAAAREVREETGVIVQIERAVGLYYLEATQRLNILFAGFPVGGELKQHTDEARGNRYFWLSSLPDNVFGREMVKDALSDEPVYLRMIGTPATEIRRIRRKLAWRYVHNLLRGQPEPRHVRFDVRAVAIIWDENHKRVLTMRGAHEQVLPFVICWGEKSPWQVLSEGLRGTLGIDAPLHWVGIWQNTADNAVELIFAATVQEQTMSKALWVGVQNAALIGRDADYVTHTRSTYARDDVWFIVEDEAYPDRLVVGDAARR